MTKHFHEQQEQFNEKRRNFNTRRQEFSEIKAFVARFQFTQQQDSPFEYLFRSKNTYGSATLQEIEDTVLHSAKDGQTSLIAFIGPLGSGKTTTLELMERVMKDRLGDNHVATITAEQGLREAMEEDHSPHTSGSFTPSDYQKGTAKFKQHLEKAIENPEITCILVEAPLVTGFKLQPDAKELLGMDRGVTAFRELFGIGGKYRDTQIWIAGLTIAESYRKAKQQRLRRPHDDQRPGGTYVGTILGDKDLQMILSANDYDLAKRAGIPKSIASLHTVTKYRKLIVAGLLEWVLKDYLAIDSKHALIAENIFT